MELKENVLEAVRVLEECDVPEDLRAVAFEKIFDALGTGTTGGAVSSESQAGSGGAIERVAARLKTSTEHVSGVFYENGNELALGVSPSKLDKSVASATKQIALLIAASRQASGVDEEWTSVDVIREVCRDFKKLDANNFAVTITEMHDVFNFRGKGKQREVRVAQPGWPRVKSLVEVLSGGGAG